MPDTADTEPLDLEVLLAGLPGTGKTTYLAVLYLAISADRAAGFSLGTYRDDREYVNRIAKQLLECKEARHTEVEEQGQMRLSLLVGEDKRSAVLEVPDLSGETWEHALYERSWPASVDAAARSANGVLLFVHVTAFDAAPSIHAAHTALRALGEDAEQGPRVRAKSADGGQPVESVHPTQVQLVDLLQLLSEERAERPTRAAIVLSAWDLISGDLTPERWLATNAPLVEQYLRANATWLDASVWGVSAQGGSFRDDNVRQSLLPQHPVDRARGINSEGARCAIEEPLRWILRIDP